MIHGANVTRSAPAIRATRRDHGSSIQAVLTERRRAFARFPHSGWTAPFWPLSRGQTILAAIVCSGRSPNR